MLLAAPTAPRAASDPATALVLRLQSSTAWQPTMEGAAREAANIILKAAELVVSQEAPITVIQILEATCTNAKALPSSLGSGIDGIALDTLDHAALAYLLAAKPQPFVRRIDHQMDRCGGTNISQFTFGGFSLALAVSAADAWRANTMVPGHTKFGPDKTALNLANKYAPQQSDNQP